MQKIITFLKWNPKRDFYTDNLVCRVHFSVIDSALIGTSKERESIHNITISITDILLNKWGVPGGLDFGITDDMVKVALQFLEDYLTQQIKQSPLPEGELEALILNTENSPESCPYKLANILYPSKTSFEVEMDDQYFQRIPSNQININGNVFGSTIIIGDDNKFQAQPLSNAGNLEIVDIAFQDEPQIILDIKLRNASSQVAFIKKVTVMVHNIWRLSPVCSTGALILPSANYDLELPIKETPYMIEGSVSQAISPNGVDRFTLTLLSPPHYAILAQLSLVYDSDNKNLSSNNLIFAKRGSSCSYPTIPIEELTRKDKEIARQRNNTWETKQWLEKRETFIHNNSVREQIRTVTGIRNKVIKYLEAF